MKAFK